MNFAQRLRELMESQALTNYQLAKDLDVHPTTITNWLDGKEPRKKTLASLAAYFNVSTNYLLGNEENKKSPAPEAQGNDVKPLIDMVKKHRRAGVTLMYNGTPIDEATMKLLEASLEAVDAAFEANSK